MKKAVLSIFCFLITLSTAFSAQVNAVDTFVSILPLGTYSGVNELNSKCSVEVAEVNFPEKAISVTVLKGNHKVFKKIEDSSEYYLRGFNKEFIQSERYYVDATRNSYVDRIVRTVMVSDTQLYVVVANEITVNRERLVESLECIINL